MLAKPLLTVTRRAARNFELQRLSIPFGLRGSSLSTRFGKTRCCTLSGQSACTRSYTVYVSTSSTFQVCRPRITCRSSLLLSSGSVAPSFALGGGCRGARHTSLRSTLYIYFGCMPRGVRASRTSPRPAPGCRLLPSRGISLSYVALQLVTCFASLRLYPCFLEFSLRSLRSSLFSAVLSPCFTCAVFCAVLFRLVSTPRPEMYSRRRLFPSLLSISPN